MGQTQQLFLRQFSPQSIVIGYTGRKRRVFLFAVYVYFADSSTRSS